MNSFAEQRLLVISPIRNEAAHFDRVADAVAGQTRPPDAWVVVDDDSDDGTAAILGRLTREIDFLIASRTARDVSGAVVRDRLAAAAAPRAFNRGLATVPLRSFTHVAKLDGDVELPPRYFELLLARFAEDPLLGIAGGVRLERAADGWRLERPPLEYHVPGALKCYSIQCLETIGGVQERLAWDTIDELYARMHGYRTRAFPDLVALHHRPWGSADGSLRGRARHGRCAYIVHYPLPWVAARALFRPQEARPRALSALCYVGGYGLAAIRRTPRVQDPSFRRFMRTELWTRARRAMGAGPAAARVTPGPLAPARGSAEHHG